MNKTKTTALGVLSAEEYTAACSCAGTTVELIKPYTADDYDEQQAQQAFTIPKNLTAGCWYEANSDHSERTGRRDLVLAQIAHRNRREKSSGSGLYETRKQMPPLWMQQMRLPCSTGNRICCIPTGRGRHAPVVI